MSAQLNCNEHGVAEAAAVCVHVNHSLTDGVPRGFLWLLDPEDGYSAICEFCNEKPIEEWERDKDEQHVELCIECFRTAAAINGVTLTMVH